MLSRLHSRLVSYVLAILLLLFTAWIFLSSVPRHSKYTQFSSWKKPSRLKNSAAFIEVDNFTKHPILQLHENAERSFTELLSRQSKTLDEAVQNYIKRYGGRLPPPNFDKWFKFAKSVNSPIIDDYDSVEEALRPLWGLPPKVIRARMALASSQPRVSGFAVKQGKLVYRRGYYEDWIEDAVRLMLKEFLEFLPDMDLPFNALDEPRVIVPFEQMEDLIQNAEKAAFAAADSNAVIKEFSKHKAPTEDEMRLESLLTDFHDLPMQATWTYNKMSCANHSPARALHFDGSIFDASEGLHFINNYTAAQDICNNPSYQIRHGIFVHPTSFNIVQNIVPIFSQSKISTNADILLPSYFAFATEMADLEELKITTTLEWEKRPSKLYWRGSTTGGYSGNGEWKLFHRHRFVDMVNGESIVQTYQPDEAGTNYHLVNSSSILFQSLFDVRFTSTSQCSEIDCKAQQAHFRFASREAMSSQANKYLLDLDGNAFSGRFYNLLKGTSVVIKQTLFKEWHDERLIPWLHYIPLSLDGTEIFEIVSFLEENDDFAKKMADGAKNWMEKGVRPKDMMTYSFRLLLELARIMDDERDKLGFRMAD